MRKYLPALLLASLALLIAAPLAAQQLTPAQAAYVKAETRKADDIYVTEVAKIVGIKRADVVRALPAKGRITDPVARLFAALEHQLGKPLDDAQKEAITAAETKRHERIAQVNLEAAKTAQR